MSEVATLEPKRLPTIVAGAKVQPIIPGDFDSAYRIAQAVCIAGMAPKGLDTPEKAFVAVMHGLEVGLPPMQALQSIAVINGRPSIWGDGAIGLVRGSGLCEFIRERIDGEGDKRIAICEAKRRGETEPVVGKFSVADAKQAGLWGKTGRSGEPTPWVTYPNRMLQMRARAFALRDGFADVLRGLHIAEEMQDLPDGEPKDITPPPAPKIAPKAPPAPIKVAESYQGRQPPAKPVDPPHDPDTGEVFDDERTLPEHLQSQHDMQAPESGEDDDGRSDTAEPEERASEPPTPTEALAGTVQASEDWRAEIIGLLSAAKTMRAIDTIVATRIDPVKDEQFPGDVGDCLREVEKTRKRVSKNA